MKKISKCLVDANSAQGIMWVTELNKNVNSKCLQSTWGSTA